MAQYKLIKYDGDNEKYKGKMVRQYQDGSIRDERGYFVERHPATENHMITSENASDYVRLRVEKYRQAAADAVLAEIGSAHPGVNTPEAAWGVLNGKLAVQIIDSEKPRGRDLEYLGRNIGAIATQADGVDGGSDAAGLVDAVNNLLLTVVNDVLGRDKADVIDVD